MPPIETMFATYVSSEQLCCLGVRTKSDKDRSFYGRVNLAGSPVHTDDNKWMCPIITLVN